MIRLTTTQFETLEFIGAYLAKHGRTPSQIIATEHFGVGHTTVYHRYGALEREGCIQQQVRGRHGGPTLLDAGNELLAAGREKATARPARPVEPVAALPASVVMPAAALPVVLAVHEAARDGRALTLRQIAAATDRSLSVVALQVRGLREVGAIAHRDPAERKDRYGTAGVHLTAVGVGVAEGRVRLTPTPGTGRATPARATAPRKQLQVDLTPRPVRDVEPRPAPPPPASAVRLRAEPRAAVQVEREELADLCAMVERPDAPSLPPAVPPGFDPNAPRPVRHPAPPAPAAKPEGMRPGDWLRRTSAPFSRLHDACARGAA